MTDVPRVHRGSTPGDGGLLSKLSGWEVAALHASDPRIGQRVRPYLGNAQALACSERWCLWLDDASVRELQSSPVLRELLDEVAAFRSGRTRRLVDAATRPWRFLQVRQPHGPYLVLPTNAFLGWGYLPAAIHEVDVIAGDDVLVVEDDILLMAGLTMSKAFFVWACSVGTVDGGRVRVGAEAVYNTFPFPNLDSQVRSEIEAGARAVLSARSYFAEGDLDALYGDPEGMPPQLVRAHQELDHAVAASLGLDEEATDEEVLTALERRHELLSQNAPPPGRRQRAA